MEKIEKLELKHLCGYLPYKLKWRFFESGIYTMSGITNEKIFVEEGHSLTWNIDPEFKQALFPILLPLSALIEPLEDGYSYAERLFFAISGGYPQIARKNGLLDFTDNILYTPIQQLPFWIIEKLFEWHFDIYGLIPARLAFDKRTVKL